MKQIINRIKLSRKALKHDYTGSLIVLENDIKNARELNAFLEKLKADKKLKHEARKHLIVTAVSSADIFLKLLAVELTEIFMIYEDENVLRELKKYFVLELEEDTTLSEVLYATKSFYDLGEIERFFSSLVGTSKEKLTVEIENAGVEMDGRIKYFNEDYRNYREAINELMDMRHKLIHHGKLKRMPSLKRINALIENLVAYLSAISAIIEFCCETYPNHGKICFGFKRGGAPLTNSSLSP